MSQDPIHTLIETIAKNLVDTSDALKVEKIELEDKIIYRVHTPANEAGQVIGKEGKLSGMIRGLVKASARKHGFKKPVYMEVVDPARESF